MAWVAELGQFAVGYLALAAIVAGVILPPLSVARLLARASDRAFLQRAAAAGRPWPDGKPLPTRRMSRRETAIIVSMLGLAVAGVVLVIWTVPAVGLLALRVLVSPGANDTPNFRAGAPGRS